MNGAWNQGSILREACSVEQGAFRSVQCGSWEQGHFRLGARSPVEDINRFCLERSSGFIEHLVQTSGVTLMEQLDRICSPRWATTGSSVLGLARIVMGYVEHKKYKKIQEMQEIQEIQENEENEDDEEIQ